MGAIRALQVAGFPVGAQEGRQLGETGVRSVLQAADRDVKIAGLGKEMGGFLRKIAAAWPISRSTIACW